MTQVRLQPTCLLAVAARCCPLVITFSLVGHSVSLDSTLAPVTKEADRNASHSLVPVLHTRHAPHTFLKKLYTVDRACACTAHALAGKLPTELGCLTSLTLLNLKRNNLTGELSW
jgi:hypothetical protein